MSKTVTYWSFITLIETTVINYYFTKVTCKSIGGGQIVFYLISLFFPCQYLHVTIRTKYSILFCSIR